MITGDRGVARVFWGDRDSHRLGWWVDWPGCRIADPIWGPTIDATDDEIRESLRTGRNRGTWDGEIRIERP
jgi:hypothetical protein